MSLICMVKASKQATQHWDTTLMCWTILLPPGAGEGWDGGASASDMGPGSSPLPLPSSVSGGGLPVCQSHVV